MTNAALQKKLSVKTLGLEKVVILEKVMKDKKNVIPLAIFYGQMTRTKSGEMTTPDGEVRAFTGLRGIFKGINVETKETVSSSVCYLPDVALDLILGQFKEGERIEFAVQIGARFSEKAATNYEYTAEFLTEVSNDPLAALEKLVSEKAPEVLKLAAPSAKKDKKAAA